MNLSWKNRLQEYCMKNKFSLPDYRLRKQSGPPHLPKFQFEVVVNGQCYIGDDLCISKKDAEQSAASKAWDAIVHNNTNSIPIQPTVVHNTSMCLQSSSPNSDVMKSDTVEHLPSEHAGIEKYISTMIESFDGRIRKIRAVKPNGLYKFDITGSYRYCDNVKRHHKKNQIFFMIDVVRKTYYQMCYDPECFGFRSVIKNIVIEPEIPINSKEKDPVALCPNCQKRLKNTNQEQCNRCETIFCDYCVAECDFCDDRIHCQRCLELCHDYQD